MSGHEANENTGAGGVAPLAVRLRMAADGELEAADREALEAHLARSLEDRARIQFEQELKGAVGRVMDGATAPASLRARVVEIIEASREDAAASAPESEPMAAVAPTVESVEAAPSVEPESAPERMAPMTREPSFWSRRGVLGGLAAAAVLALATVFIVRMAGITSVPLSADQEAYRAQLVRHVAGEHRRMEDPDAASRKLAMHEPDEVERFFSEVMDAPGGEVRQLIESTAQCVFSGAGNCRIPGADGAAAHVMLSVGSESGSAPVSVFVSADPHQLPMDPGETYVIDTGACGEGGTRVLAWTDGRLLYLVVSEAERRACPAVLKRLGRPGPGRKL